MLSENQKKKFILDLKTASNLGTSIIVAWRPLAFGILLFQIPIYEIATRSALLLERLSADNHHISDEEIEALENSGCITTEITLPFEVPVDECFSQFVEDSIQPYVVQWSSCRGVVLFDIVAFSKYAAFEQMAQIRVLSNFIDLAAQRCRTLGHDIKVSKSTTGDGFYVWNEVEGVEGDIALYLSTMLTLAYYYGARQSNLTRGFPLLRCCINFGSHFEYRGAVEKDSNCGDYIVGDVTIGLARMMSAARPSQLLVGVHSRDISGTNFGEHLGRDTMDTTSLIDIGRLCMKNLIGISLPGGKIARADAYLTGSKISDREFTIKKYSVADKHGMTHHCYNANFNLEVSGSKTINVGLKNDDLDSFVGTPLEDQELKIRVR